MSDAQWFADEAKRHADDAVRYAEKAVRYGKIARALAVTAIVAAVAAIVMILAACGGSSPAAPAASPSPTPTFTALTLPDACTALRADILANGGSPGPAVLRRIIGHSTDGKLIDDARLALHDIGKSDIAMGIILGSLGYDCRSTGVQIPQNPGSV